jgi:hypothetical protein
VPPTASRLLLQALFTESSCRELPLHLLCCTQSTPPSFLCVLFSSLFIIQFFFFCRAGVSLSRGLCWFIPGVAVGVSCATYLLTCWCEFPKPVWSLHLAAREPSCFLSGLWHGVALFGLGVRSVGVLFILGGFFLPRVAPVSQQNF